MEEKLDLTNEKLQILQNSLESKTSFLKAVNNLVLGQNVPISNEAMNAWFNFCFEDISSGKFEFDDFIKATKEYLRTPLSYGRLSYAECYELAVCNFKDRRNVPNTKRFESDPKAIKSFNKVKEIIDKEISKHAI